MFWTLYDSPRLSGTAFGPNVPRWLKQFQYWASDTLFIRPLLGGDLNGLRRELGLAPVKRILSHWLHNTDLVLGLFPDWFGPMQPDWPTNMRLVGFPLWDIAAGEEITLDQVTTIAGSSVSVAFTALPFSPRFEDGVAAMLALRLAPRLGMDNIPAMVIKQAASGWSAIQANFMRIPPVSFDPMLTQTSARRTAVIIDG
jgi:hypothetical protein